MTPSARRSLKAELGDRVPDGLGTLTDAQRADVADRLHDARSRQSRALDVAIGDALEIVPRLLRRPVRRILFG